MNIAITPAVARVCSASSVLGNPPRPRGAAPPGRERRRWFARVGC